MPNPPTQRRTTLEIRAASNDCKLELPLSEAGVSAGFPSAADDFLELSIDLNRELIANPAATFFGRVRGDSMRDFGIDDGDLLVIDKSVEARDGTIAVCFVDGEFTLKKIRKDQGGCWLMPGNDAYRPIRVSEDNEFLVWGAVRHVIKTL